MRPHLFVILVILLGLSVGPVVSDSAVPSIQFKKTTVDFGKVLHGQKVNIPIPFKNAGKALLQITSVSATCGCTKSSVTKNKLKPGESAQVMVIFDSKNYVGPIRKSVYVNTNDPANATVRLHITGEVLSVVELTPPTLDLGDLKTGTTAERTLTITPKTQRKFKIVAISSTGKQVTVPKFDKEPATNGTYSMTIKATAGATTGRLMEYVNISTDLPGVPPIRYLIYGNIVDASSQPTNIP